MVGQVKKFILGLKLDLAPKNRGSIVAGTGGRTQTNRENKNEASEFEEEHANKFEYWPIEVQEAALDLVLWLDSRPDVQEWIDEADGRPMLRETVTKLKKKLREFNSELRQAD